MNHPRPAAPQHPYRGAPAAPSPLAEYLPRPPWRRIPCLLGVHRWRCLDGGEVPDRHCSCLRLCARCGAHGDGAEYDLPTVSGYPETVWGSRRIRRYAGPPLSCRRCGRVEDAPSLHGCPPDYLLAARPARDLFDAMLDFDDRLFGPPPRRVARHSIHTEGLTCPRCGRTCPGRVDAAGNPVEFLCRHGLPPPATRIPSGGTGLLS